MVDQVPCLESNDISLRRGDVGAIPPAAAESLEERGRIGVARSLRLDLREGGLFDRLSRG